MSGSLLNPGPLLKSMCVFKLFDNLCGEKLYCLGKIRSLGCIPIYWGFLFCLFEENSAGEYLKTLWGIENENLHSARGICAEEPRTRIIDLQWIKNYDKFMYRVKKALVTSLENQG